MVHTVHVEDRNKKPPKSISSSMPHHGVESRSQALDRERAAQEQAAWDRPTLGVRVPKQCLSLRHDYFSSVNVNESPRKRYGPPIALRCTKLSQRGERAKRGERHARWAEKREMYRGVSVVLSVTECTVRGWRIVTSPARIGAASTIGHRRQPSARRSHP